MTYFQRSNGNYYLLLSGRNWALFVSIAIVNLLWNKANFESLAVFSISKYFVSKINKKKCVNKNINKKWQHINSQPITN